MPGVGGSFGDNFSSFDRGGWGNRRPPPGLPTSQFGNPATFTAAANTQAGDYDRIMKSYADTVSRFSGSPLTSTNVTPQVTQQPQDVTSKDVSATTTPYSQSADVTGSLKNLSDLSATGGYTAQGIQDLRARGVSPTRSIYAQGQQELQRNRALGGGYSPNFAAASGQMARDESNQIADINTNVNAGIAQNVASNRLAASGTYAGAAGSANAERTQAEQRNTDIVNQINQANEGRRLETQTGNVNRRFQAGEAGANRDLEARTGNANRNLEAQFGNRRDIFSGIQGQANLYGTTPALTNTFGNQVATAANLGQNQQGLDQQRRRDYWSNIRGAM